MKTIETGRRTDDLGISEETLAAIILEARAFDAVPDDDNDDDLHVETDEDELIAQENLPENPTEQVLIEGIQGLSMDEQETLVALVWVGRGDFDADEWEEARRLAAERDNGDIAHYLSGMSLLGDYLEAGAAALGIDLSETEAQTMSHPARRSAG